VASPLRAEVERHSISLQEQTMPTNGNGTFAGKVAFVTGAASGIGRATALAFAREGASVVVADSSEPGSQEVARMIKEGGGRALAVRCDVSQAEDVKAALDKTVETFGRLDYAKSNIRINAVCPGIIETPMMDHFSGGTAEGRERVIAQEPVGRMGRPEEIAAAVLWLCSDATAFVVGHALVVDGGQTV
jgi:NAD(P)-dependent dehydrogenase (short-subunit alcohol dehydrogenase family)